MSVWSIYLFSAIFIFQLTVIVCQNNGCMDKNVPGRASDCPRVAYLCNNQLYKQLMEDQCPATCMTCGSGAGSGSGMGGCVDKAAPGRASDCPQLKSYCKNTIYRDLMTDQCPFTCEICRPG